MTHVAAVVVIWLAIAAAFGWIALSSVLIWKLRDDDIDGTSWGLRQFKAGHPWAKGQRI